MYEMNKKESVFNAVRTRPTTLVGGGEKLVTVFFWEMTGKVLVGCCDIDEKCCWTHG